MSLRTLKKIALESTDFRGHRMTRFKRYNAVTAFATCKDCGMQVAVTTKPLPNDIDVGGEAVALTCEKSMQGV